MQTGTRLGPYEIVAPLGAGGMGEVYRARDTKLGRDVALKVLPSAFAADPERMARFEREAVVLASLNHSNIGSIYGIEESGAVRALVMELVEGPTLADRIAQGPVPVGESIAIARQIAEALEDAHDRGIVHRDLKPANVKVTPTGQVKVLDFGLAKALDSEAARRSASLSPTMSLAATQAGVILGTAAYMSPEQAKGKPVDKRADIWAFGVVFVEMFTGRPLFAGETVTETLASVMKDAPVIPDAPPAIRDLLRRCLQQDPRRRLRDIGEARLVLEDPATGEWPKPVDGTPIAAPAPSHAVAWAGALVAAAVASGVAAWMLKPAPTAAAPAVRKFNLPIDKLQAGGNRAPQISPDGTKIIYSSDSKLWIRDLNALEPRELVAAGNPRNYFWSPDSAHVAYLADDKLWKVAVNGGQPSVVTVLRQPLGNGVGGAWQPDGKIVLTTAMPNTGLQSVSSGGGDFTTLLTPAAPAEQDFHDVSHLPDGKGLLYVVDRGANLIDTIAVLSGQTKKTILHLEGESLRVPQYAASGHVLYERVSNNPGIWALPFSLDTLAPAGDPFLVVPQGSLPSVSGDGTLVSVRQAPAGPRELVWVDRSGRVERTIGQPLTGLSWPELAPDAGRVAVSAVASGQPHIWLYDVARGTNTRLTFGEGGEAFPAWAPGNDRVFFMRSRPGASARSIVSQAADGTGQVEPVVEGGNNPTISRDGKFLAYVAPGREPQMNAQDLWYVPLDGDKKPALFLEAPNNQTDPRFSPDGRYLAYTSAESGRQEVYLKAFPSGDGKWQVSLNGGSLPRWNKSGDRLFFIDGVDQKLMEVEVTLQPALRLGTPRVVLTAPMGIVGPGWDVAPDGQRFVFIRQISNPQAAGPAITVVENWFAEFKK